jgi:hypothetical protein
MLILNRKTRVEAAVAAQSGHIVTTVPDSDRTVLVGTLHLPIPSAANCGLDLTHNALSGEREITHCIARPTLPCGPDINQTGQRAKEWWESNCYFRSQGTRNG